MNHDDYSPAFDIVRKTVWYEELAEELAQQLADARSTAKGLLKLAKEQNLEEHIRQYRSFRYRDHA